MASTVFTDYVTPIVASWLNDVNNFVYSGTLPNNVAVSGNLSVGGTTTLTGNTAVTGTLTVGGLPVTGSPYNATAVNFLQAGTGAVTRTVQSKEQDVVSVLDFGADPTGTVDSTTAIQAAINAVQTAGGGKVIFPAGRFKISSTLNVTGSGVFLVGAGGSQNHDVGLFQYVTNFDWAGAAGGDMVVFASPAGASAQRQSTGGVNGFKFSGATGANVAGRGLVVQSWAQGSFDSLMFEEFSTCGLEVGVISGSLGEAKDSQQNKFSRITSRIVLNSGDAIRLTGESVANCSINVWEGLYLVHKNGKGIVFGSSDNNHFTQVSIFRQASGTGFGVEFQGATVAGAVARSNHIVHCSPGQGGIIGRGTTSYTSPSHDNTVWFLDRDNGSADPVLETGAGLWWADDYNRNYRGKFIRAAFGEVLANADAAQVSLDTTPTTSLLVRNTNNDNVRLSDGTNVWSIAIVSGNIRIARIAGTGLIDLGGGACDTKINGGVGFYGASTVSSRPAVTGSRGGNAALASLLTQLATQGLITDSTTA